MSVLADLLEISRGAALAAGEAALVHYSGHVAVENKADGSPITLADRAAHAAAVGRLATSGLPVLSEESAHADVKDRLAWPRFWLVDPLDGTKEFLKKSGEFTVNVALVEGHEAVLGVVHLPVTGVTYLGCRGHGSHLRRGTTEQPIRARPLAAPLTVLASRDHAGPGLEAILARVPDAVRASAGSALKFGLLAQGEADLYVRDQPTMEWDTAAGQAVLEAAGGRVTDFTGQPLRYNKASLVNPAFVAWGDAAIDWPRRLALS